LETPATFLSHSSTLNVSPMSIDANNAMSYRPIWNVYGFK